MSYKIQSGDTLSQIALQQGTSVPALARANSIEDVDVIQAGDTLRIPGRTDAFSPASTGGGGAPPNITGSDAPGSLTGPRSVLPRGSTAPAFGADSSDASSPSGSAWSGGGAQGLDVAKQLAAEGRSYGNVDAYGPVGVNSPTMNCAQYVNAANPDLPASALDLRDMATAGLEPKPGDIVTSAAGSAYGHVGIMGDDGMVYGSQIGTGPAAMPYDQWMSLFPLEGVIPR